MEKLQSGKNGQTDNGHLISLTHNTYTQSRCIQNLKKLAQIGAEKSVTIREKEKWTNKETDEQEMADYFLHNTTYHSQCTKFHLPKSSSS